MSELQWFALVIAVLSELTAAVLVAMETAINRTSSVRAEEFREERRRGAEQLVRITADPARYLNALLFARIGFSVLAIVLVATLISQLIAGPIPAVFVATIIMLIANFVVVGVAPRTLGQQHFAGLALATSGLVRVITAIITPFARVFILVGNALTPGKGFKQGPFASEAEIRALLDQAGEQDLIEPAEQRMLESVFELGDTICRELMVPRTEMVFIERTKKLRQALSLCLRSGFSRIPVTGSSLDDVVGVVTLKDMVSVVRDNPQAEDDSVALHMRPVMCVPDTKRADVLLQEFQSSRTHLAILIDEYGGTAGLVTVEDILEEIVGEISDEHDVDEIAACIQLGDRQWRVSSRMALDDLSELIDVDLEDDADSVETVGGLLGRRLGVVPIPGSQVEVGDFVLTAETAEGRRNRIASVLIYPRPQELLEAETVVREGEDSSVTTSETQGA